MRELPDVIKSILLNHPANLFFDIRVIDYEAGSVSLSLELRSEFAKASYTTSALGCALDCIARIAGHEPLGYCAASEFEVSFHDGAVVMQFVATATVESVDNRYASYSGRIYAVDKQHNRLVANASGTLTRMKNNIALIADHRVLHGAHVS